MPLQNRVLPTGEIVADPALGLLTGNRGILQFEDGHLQTRRWAHKHWISCSLTHPRGRYHGPQPARGWTPLFFLDEAVALAAGHRPCAYCRRDAYLQFRAAWARAFGSVPEAGEIDRSLHNARVTRQRHQITHRASCADLPTGSFIAIEDAVWLVMGDTVLLFQRSGYSDRHARPDTEVTVLTPAPVIAVLAQGYAPLLHPSAATTV